MHPASVVTLRYDDEEGLAARGIDVRPPRYFWDEERSSDVMPPRGSPQAFPANRFAPPPPPYSDY